MPSALITGVQGQTGYFLADIFQSHGWQVHGTANVPTPAPAQSGVVLHALDFGHPGALLGLLDSINPSVVVNLAAISSVAEAWKNPRETLIINTGAVAEIAEYVTQRDKGSMRVVQASSSEIFGNTASTECDELTPIQPVNPYGVSKAASHLLGQVYRSSGYSWSNAILFNHESPRRPLHFLSRKVSSGVARIARGLSDHIELGDLSSARDWGWAPDYAEALFQIAVHPVADDFIVATGVAHTVQEYVQEAFHFVGIEDWQSYVRFNTEFMRPTEVRVATGNAAKLTSETGWSPSVSFTEMVHRMVDADLEFIATS